MTPLLPLSLALGFTTLVNDPFLNRRGLSSDLQLGVSERFSVGLRGQYYPNLGEGDWTATMRRAIGVDQRDELPRETLETSRLMASSLATVSVLLWANETEKVETRVSAIGSAGWVFTDDDLKTGGTVQTGDIDGLEHQWHPTVGASLSLDAMGSHAGIRVRGGMFTYEENIVLNDVPGTIANQPRYPVEFTVELLLRP